jgi:hypothetical protein
VVDPIDHAPMPWDPGVLRKYNSTSHFRLINQLRNELRDNPLVRPGDGERIGDVNRSKGLIRAMEARQARARSSSSS